MEGKSADHFENHFPVDPMSADIQNDTIQRNQKKNDSKLDVIIFFIVSFFTVFNLALTLFVSIRKFT